MRTTNSASKFVGTIIIPSCLQALVGVRAVAAFKSHGLNVEFASFPGGREWQEWCKSLHNFIQQIY